MTAKPERICSETTSKANEKKKMSKNPKSKIVKMLNERISDPRKALAPTSAANDQKENSAPPARSTGNNREGVPPSIADINCQRQADVASAAGKDEAILNWKNVVTDDGPNESSKIEVCPGDMRSNAISIDSAGSKIAPRNRASSISRLPRSSRGKNAENVKRDLQVINK